MKRLITLCILIAMLWTPVMAQETQSMEQVNLVVTATLIIYLYDVLVAVYNAGAPPEVAQEIEETLGVMESLLETLTEAYQQPACIPSVATIDTILQEVPTWELSHYSEK